MFNPIPLCLRWLLLWSALWGSSALWAEPLDRVVAIVNEEAITLTELNQKLTRAIQMLPPEQRDHLPPEPILREQMLNQLINEKLEWKLVEKMNLTLAPGKLKKAIQQIADRNHMTTAQLKQAIQNTHLDWEEWRKGLERELKIEQFEQELLIPAIEVTEAEVDAEIKRLNAQKELTLPTREQVWQHLNEMHYSRALMTWRKQIRDEAHVDTRL